MKSLIFDKYNWSSWNYETEEYREEKYLADLIEIELDRKIEAYELNNKGYELEIEYDEKESKGCIRISFEEENYEDEYKINSYQEFIEKMKNLDGIFENFDLNMQDYIELKKDPYGFRGLEVRDFI